VFSASGSDFDTVLAVYTGDSLSNLAAIASDDDGGGFLNSKVSFPAVGGTEYQVAIGGLGTSAGEIRLQWNVAPASNSNLRIIQPPASQSLRPGEVANFSVVASAVAGIGYQWLLNSSPLPGETNSSLVVRNAGVTNVGAYAVRLTTSGEAPLESLPAYLELGLGLTPASSPVPVSDKLMEAADPHRIPLAVGFEPITRIFHTHGRTKEPGEPTVCGEPGGASAWLALRAEGSGTLSVVAEGDGFPTVLALYRATTNTPGFSDLIVVGCATDNSSGRASSHSILGVQQGELYYLAVDGVGGRNGVVSLTGQIGFPPVVTVAERLMALHPGESDVISVHASGSTPLFYQWRFNGQDLPGQTNTSLAIEHARPSQAGVYSVVVSNAFGVTESLEVELTVGFLCCPPPARGFTGTQQFRTWPGTKQPGEPIHCGETGGASVWYAIEAKDPGALIASTEGSDFDTVLAIYEGDVNLDDFTRLRTVACDNNSGADGKTSRVEFMTPGQKIYYLAVDGVGGAAGQVSLNYTLAATPEILEQPLDQVVVEGEDTFFAVVASVTPLLSLQWRANGVPIPGGTNATLFLNDVTAAQEGTYTCTISNPAGSVTTTPARLRVVPRDRLLVHALRFLPLGAFELQVTGPLQGTTVVSSSIDLVQWQPVWTNQALSGPAALSFGFLDFVTELDTQRFYRAVKTP
jgi:hypothetical protein